jgi:hypothetical protein
MAQASITLIRMNLSGIDMGYFESEFKRSPTIFTALRYSYCDEGRAKIRSLLTQGVTQSADEKTKIIADIALAVKQIDAYNMPSVLYALSHHPEFFLAVKSKLTEKLQSILATEGAGAFAANVNHLSQKPELVKEIVAPETMRAVIEPMLRNFRSWVYDEGTFLNILNANPEFHAVTRQEIARTIENQVDEKRIHHTVALVDAVTRDIPYHPINPLAHLLNDVSADVVARGADVAAAIDVQNGRHGCFWVLDIVSAFRSRPDVLEKIKPESFAASFRNIMRFANTTEDTQQARNAKYCMARIFDIASETPQGLSSITPDDIRNGVKLILNPSNVAWWDSAAVATITAAAKDHPALLEAATNTAAEMGVFVAPNKGGYVGANKPAVGFYVAPNGKLCVLAEGTELRGFLYQSAQTRGDSSGAAMVSLIDAAAANMFTPEAALPALREMARSVNATVLRNRAQQSAQPT